jgi:hypothetical protein
MTVAGPFTVISGRPREWAPPCRHFHFFEPGLAARISARADRKWGLS